MGPILTFRFILRFLAKDFAALESAQLKIEKSFQKTLQLTLYVLIETKINFNLKIKVAKTMTIYMGHSVVNHFKPEDTYHLEITFKNTN